MRRIDEVIRELESQRNAEAVAGMARYGINPQGNLGVPVRVLRAMAKSIGRDHELALALFASGIHDARILASIVDEPARITEAQMEAWVATFDSWDACDQVCNNMFSRTPFAREKAREWSGRGETFVKRAGFVLMASLAVHDRGASDSLFRQFLDIVCHEAADERNHVRKSVNWALRQIGKRNASLHAAAVRVAEELKAADSKAARWVGSDAWRELTSAKVGERLAR